MSTTISEEQLRIALGNALLTFNKEVLADRNKQEKVLFNKLALKYIGNVLDELKIVRP